MHLRLYVAITSVEPLRILILRDGLVLFANAEYVNFIRLDLPLF